MVKIELELTEEQVEKVEELASYGIDFGKLIDNFYEARNRFSLEIEEIEKNDSFFGKVKVHSLDVDSKAENLDENFAESNDYDESVRDAKQRVSWAKDIFAIKD